CHELPSAFQFAANCRNEDWRARAHRTKPRTKLTPLLQAQTGTWSHMIRGQRAVPFGQWCLADVIAGEIAAALRGGKGESCHTKRGTISLRGVKDLDFCFLGLGQFVSCSRVESHYR